jgi:hypothetical protein
MENTTMHGGTGNERMLRRIIALLVVFAGLAEGAAGRSFAARFILLLVLRRAEGVARDYVAGAMLVDGLWFDDGLENGSRPEDAILLGLRFRTLAAVFQTFLAPDGCVGEERHETGAGMHRACRRASPRARRFAAAVAARAGTPDFHDTS